MVRIPTYKSKLTPTPTFTKPQSVRGVAENVEAISNFANKIADEQAEIKAYEKGFKQQSDVGSASFVADDNDAYSITGAAYQKGARAALVSDLKNDTENELNQYAIDYQYEPEKYKKNFEAFKTKKLQNIPQILLPEVTNYIDNIGNRLLRNVNANKIAFDRKEQAVSVTNRFEKLLPEISSSIRKDGNDNTTSINLYGELFTDIKVMEEAKFNPTVTNNLKIKLQDEIIKSSLIYAYEQSEDKQKFIADVQKGKVGDILNDVADTYNIENFEFKRALTQTEANSISSNLNTILRYDVNNSKVERQNYNDTFSTWYETSLKGLDAGEQPDITKARNLFFSDEKIDDYNDKIEIVNAIAPDLNSSRFGTLAESQKLLKEANTQNALLLSEPASDERNKDLKINEQKITALASIVDTKQKAINDGDAFKILSLQGITYSFDNEEEIRKTHELVKTNIGVSADRLTVIPKQNLEQYKTEYENASTQEQALATAGKYKAQFGKYTNNFLRDVEFENGSRVVFDFLEAQPSNAGVLWQSIKDAEQNKDALKNSRSDFAGDEKTFADKFKENLGASFRGNEEIYNEIFAGASAYYYKTLATVGDNEKAIQNTIKLFGNEGGIYSYVDINEQPVFIPPNVNGAQIKANVEDMLANPHKYAITSSNTFTLQDIVENKDEYTVVVEGGTAKLIQNSNVLFASEIYQKLPSGPNEYVYSDVLVSTDDGLETETSILDYDETWSFDKPNNVNNKILKNIKQTTTIDLQGFGGAEAQEIPTTAIDKVTQLKELTYKEFADTDGFPYADVFAGDLAVTTQDQQNLNAISLFIKDGDIQPFILEYLGTFDYLGKLRNEKVRNEVLKIWKDDKQRIRTTRNVESILMSPLHSLTDIVRDIEVPTDTVQISLDTGA